MYLNPWRLNLDKVFPDIHLESLLNISEVFSSRFTRVLFVRHPFERLASAYKERIAILPKDRIEPEPYYDKIRIFICRRFTLINRYRLSMNKKDPCENHIPSFEHFIKYILSIADSNNGINRLDGHWKPFSLICQVCQFKYNFIGKYETFKNDFQLFLNYFNISEWKSEKRRGASGYTTWQYRQFYSSLSDQLICRLKSLYYYDFYLFNYHLQDYINRTTLTCY